MVQAVWYPAYVFGLGPTELIIILAIVLIIFGPRKLPEIGKAIGSGIRELKKGVEGKGEEAKEEKAAASKKEEEKKE
ncbi:MAG: twin-arginine translocase TatA/TatE family subunit [Actinomycetota bacterium]|nr:twin-arginine translocase TatA/TatE family subunit [Actinomycetota bacterium]